AAAEKAAAEKAAAEKAAAEKAAAEKAAAEKAAAEKAAAEKAAAEKAAAEKAAAEKAAAEKAAAEKAQIPGVLAKTAAAGADVTRDIAAAPANGADNKPAVPSAALVDLATVRNWEGPYHSADRILRAVLGRTPTTEEVHNMTRALQEEFKLEHGGKTVTQVGLSHGYQWVTPENFQSVLNQLHGAPDLQAKLKGFVDNGTAVPANIPSQKAYPSAPVRADHHHHQYSYR
ncbi:MAG TPA: hypothetical protein V6C69_10215, partial [Trichormus sp.]